MEYFLESLPLVFTPMTILLAVVGIVAGIIIGALPGLSSTMGVALFIPVTYTMEPATGLVFLAAVYMASVYGGSISAILIQTPGTPSAVITALDGYELTKQGRSGEALSMSVISSTVGGLVSVVALMFLAPPLAKAVIAFGSAEMFLLAILGLTIIVSLSKDSLTKGMMVGLFGMLLSVVGTDTLTGQDRYTMGIMQLYGGIDSVAAVIGMYSASQVFKLAAQKRRTIQYDIGDSISQLKPVSLKVIAKNWFNMIRSGVIGTYVGILPGAGVSIASALAYNTARSASRSPEEYGNGSLEGLAASEAANNGVVGGSLIPLLTLGIPGNTVSAVFLGGLIIHGMRPGPQLFKEHGAVTYALFVGLFLATLIMMVVGLAGSKLFARISIVPTNMIVPIILALCVFGSYSISNNIFNVYIMLVFGFIGYALGELEFFQAPFVLGMVLGPIAEQEFRRALMISKGDYSIFVGSPIAIFLAAAIIFFLLYPLVGDKVKSMFPKKGS